MDKKEPTKISLSTFFLLLALIVIIIMSFIIYNLYNRNLTDTNQKLSLSNSKSESVKSDYSIKENTSSVKSNYNIEENTSSANNTISNKPSTTYSYDAVKGLYKGIATDNLEEENSNRNYELYLYEDGTFSFANYISSSTGKIGNYTIVNNSIILNYLFSTGNDASLTATSGKKTLIINNDGSITDNKPDNSSASNLTLKKDSTAEDIAYFSQHDISYLINNYSISNKAN